MDEQLNSIAPEAQSVEQPEVVAPAQSPKAEADAGQERVVDAPSRNRDFEMVDVGEGGTSETGDGNAARPAGRDGKDDADKEQPAETDGAGQPAAEEKKPEDEGTEKRPQSREENAAIHAARLRAQRDAEAAAVAKATAKVDEEIAGMKGLVNPYTQKPFRSFAELRDYNARVAKADIEKRARAEGKSVEELTEDEADRAFLTSLRKQMEQEGKAAENERKAQEARRAFIEQDVLDFAEKYPDVGVEGLTALENNKQFRQFCGSRFGREPLAELYGSYLSLMGDAASAAVRKAESRSARSTGAGTDGSAVLTPEQKKALDRWNRDNPEMKMTAKEFLGR